MNLDGSGRQVIVSVASGSFHSLALDDNYIYLADVDDRRVFLVLNRIRYPYDGDVNVPWIVLFASHCVWVPKWSFCILHLI